MNANLITRILFDDNTALEFLTEENSRFNDPDIIQKAADMMLVNLHDITYFDSISEDEQTGHLLAAAGLPKDLLDRDTSYILNDELCYFVKTRLSSKYRIGLLTMDKASARLTLGDQYASVFKDILTAEELPDNLRYLFEDTLFVSRDGIGFGEVSAVCRTHKYTSVQDLASYLKAPPPFVPAVQNGSGVAQTVVKTAAAAVPVLKSIPISVQYLIDFIVVGTLVAVVAYQFPNEFKSMLEELRKIFSLALSH